MSFENKNLFHLLGNDVEDETETPSLPIREIVKNTTSSKKADVPPPSADPAKAKKKSSKASGNEGAFKNRANNKSVSGPSSTPAKHQKKPFDRHSRTGKTDSKKQVRQGWGSEKDVVESDEAEESDNAESEPVEPATPKKSLQDYFAELQVKQQELSGERKFRQANEGNEEKWSSTDKIEKEKETYVESSIAKKQKNKSQKEKKFLDINAVFADQKQPRQESKRGAFKGAKRGSKRGGLNTKKPVVNDKNFPSL